MVPVGIPGLRHNALFLLFKFIGGYSAVQPPYQGLQYHSALPLICSGSIKAKPKVSISSSFATPCIHIECLLVFPFPHHISCMRESLLSSSCAAFVVVAKKPPMCQSMRFSLYCMNRSIEGRRIG